ncbi:COG1470 family protein [Methanooceanicella nereidis]|uniref:COG1470 family protein n=1 Tax=Methanooceanicella nereidis TaxID=2052831 RepID=UPI001E35FCE7|nr:hypothetical protein [Methanocella sp. CWC-04]
MNSIAEKGSTRVANVILCAMIISSILLPAASMHAGADIDTSVTVGEDEIEIDSSITKDPLNGNAQAGQIIVIEGYVSESIDIRDRPGVLIPIPGAIIYFIRNNTIVAQTISNPIGYYSVVVPSGKYSVVAVARSFQNNIFEADLQSTQTLNIGLIPIPFNGFVPYVRYPVLETSPGREVECSILVENFQVIDQTVTFTVITPGRDWQAWFPKGEALLVRTGGFDFNTFTLKYTGNELGTYIVKIVVNGGAYFAEIPVVVIVKDLPFEKVDLGSYSPERVVKPGSTTVFTLSLNNDYADNKFMDFVIEKPEGWTATTLNGTKFFIPDEVTADTGLYVYVPEDTVPGEYYINVTLKGERLKSNKLCLKVTVEGDPLFDAVIKLKKNEEGYPVINATEGESFEIPVRVYNNWEFPIEFVISAEIGDNWPYYINGIPRGHLVVEPGKAGEFIVKSSVPNGTTGNHTAKIYIEYKESCDTLFACVDCLPIQLPKQHGVLEGVILTAATAGTLLLASLIKFGRKRFP